VDTVDQMVSDALRNITQVEFSIDIVEFCRAEQAVNGRSAY
jgi:hypothetical protein